MNHTKQARSRPPYRLGLKWTAHKVFHLPIRTGLRKGGPGRIASCLLAAGIVFLPGCSAPAVRQQRLVARPNMTFDDSVIFAYHASKLIGQMERGYAGSGDAANAGCTSCK